jgi:DEAD/DEAH box helicase domain-containing protein
MELAQLIARWQTSPQFMDNVADWRALPAVPAVYADWPAALDTRVVAAVNSQGIAQPYNHQAEAIEAALNGQHVVMVTATASGKTLGYNAPVLQTLLIEPTARALYLFPTKALAQDQVVAFNQLAGGLGKNAPHAATYDGDTPQSARSKIRQNTPVIISNPDMLHTGILPHHPRWRKFLAKLRYIVIDELHTYRGVFGSHFANVLRRLHRICTFYGAAPQFICASATIANPHQHALALLDLVEPHRLHVVEQNGAPRAKKQLIFYNPPIIDEKLNMRRGVLVTGNEIARQLLEAEAQTVVFARARLTVEVLLTYLRDFAALKDWPAETIRGYRGGYLPLARREIETGLREGAVKGVVATNALELGVDIGGLNACVLTGYPGTIASTWQQIGRAGRRQGESVAVLVASQAPLDQFLMAHPDYFFDRGAEHARIDPDNLLIALSHLQCAAYELPFRADEPFGLFPNPREMLDYLVEAGTLRKSGEQYHWVGETYPAGEVSLRSAGIDNVVITVEEDGQITTIGEVDRPSAPLLLYPGAIYLHEGASYQITMLDLDGGRAEATPVDVGYYTRATSTTDIEILAVKEEDTTPSLHRAWGDVVVSSDVTGYRQIRRYTHETLGYGDVNLPAQAFETTAYWLTLSEAMLDQLREAGIWRQDKLDYGPADLWQRQRNAARTRDGYRCRSCNAPERQNRRHDVHHIRPLREFLEEAAHNNVDPATVYPQAHALSNLITLCPSCHRRAEVIVRTANAWGGLAYALSNLAPLFLMCDPRDIGLTYESRPIDAEALPTITLYDSIPHGLGFADQLYDLHHDLLQAAYALARDCPCQRGCPACVGPPPGESVDLRGETRMLLEVVIEK